MTTTENQIVIPEKVIFNKSAFEQFKFYTKLYSKTEWGGLCIGYQVEDAFYVRAIVLPPQKTQSKGYCEFRKELFPLITKNLIKLQNKFKGFYNYRIGVWIHTHPGFGVFFSGTDVSTFEYLTKMSPDYIGVVVDPVQNQVVGYNSRTREQEVEPVVVDEALEIEDYYEPYISFEKIEVVKTDFEVENAEEEGQFLEELTQVLSTPQAAKEIADTNLIEVFIPLEKRDHQIRTMLLRIKYLEQELGNFRHLLEFREHQGKQVKELADWYLESPIKYTGVQIPLEIVIQEKGIKFNVYNTQNQVIAKHMKWDNIEDLEVILLVQSPVPEYGYTIYMILLQITEKKKGFFAKPTTTRLLLYTNKYARLQRTLLEFKEGSKIRPFMKSDKKEPKPEPEETDEAYYIDEDIDDEEAFSYLDDDEEIEEDIEDSESV